VLLAPSESDRLMEDTRMIDPVRQPTFFIPHGGGPCFFMDDPRGVWTGMEAFLRTISARLPETPKAILVISGHWETDGFALTGAPQPPLLYDYYGFPKHTYELRYDAPGAPALAKKVVSLMSAADIRATIDDDRGLDHGVFVPLKVAFPDATIPVVEMSVDRGLDPSLHLAAGRALAPLRDEGVLIVGSGMSFHNMRGYGDARFTAPSELFDDWLNTSLTSDAPRRDEYLNVWEAAPAARVAHPDAEHLLPLMVAAAAAEGKGTRIYSEHVLKTAISGFRFD
jgi:aromatic ring-opening dioxygenase catalytic subunit (LigB family)